MATASPSFSVSQRLLRGYGPLAVFAALLLLMSLLVPSKSPKTVTAAAAGAGTGVEGDQYAAGDTGTGGGDAGAAGTQAQAGTAGQAATSGTPKPGATAAVVSKPGGDQVPGDPYSPPKIAFSGNNGGATSKGVTPTEIHVSYRSLNEKGFQQTLAALAGASLQDGPDDIKRTVS